jgi:hypothetical protein
MKKPLKVYLAAAWHRQAEMREVAKEISHLVDVTSRWLHEVPASGSKLTKERSRRMWAKRDVADVRKADVLIRFTDDLSGNKVPAKLATGSRMFEMGLAYERRMKVIVVGGFQPIFDYLPEVRHVRHLDELKVYLRGLNK